ncbi:MAG: tRNA uridine-5-carboxymethylaminomethyl(34) synthesis GTPase MnmE [Bacteroidetes bacterium GWF2_43_63]|nr:MAG: tRNA uridine-5-carboxymethylaminomethyl(34) synthesis GTPase MnmE [Bacteroidetes bacterium GWE2_42_42]OFY55494.1 MAG: tRNA uridine-5-carboxymethylaminomethyl(34) synthesis GTPase MnmE [Bacteroidetes bacterium GWF2_43_63]
MIPNLSHTICAIATPPGTGAIAVIRLSGPKSHDLLETIFCPVKKATHYPEMRHSYYGEILDNGSVLDDAVVVFYKNPESYTGEDAAEISCHGSLFIQNRLLQLLIEKGARMAEPGEFSLRAFVNGKMDLLQAEAVDDVIRSRTGSAHKLAVKQMRGDYSKKLSELRKQLVDLTALMELEIDFSEEDVEFADRSRLREICTTLVSEVTSLAESFKAGNVLKHGIPVAIVGEPNVGKSTLLNKILREERSIVSDIPGTTRDYVEDTLTVGNNTFRFIDTAGLRTTTDSIESAGVERTLVKASEASVILMLFDAVDCEEDRIQSRIEEFKNRIEDFDQKKLIVVINKIDLLVNAPKHLRELLEYDIVFISAKRDENIGDLMEKLNEVVAVSANTPDIVLTNVRHYEAFSAIANLLNQAVEHIDKGLPQDLTATFLHQALHQIGLVTGEVSNEDVLDSIFRNFCIGK